MRRRPPAHGYALRRSAISAAPPASRPSPPTISPAIASPLLAQFAFEPAPLSLPAVLARPGLGGAVSEPATSSSAPPASVTSIRGAGSSELGGPIQRTTSPLS